MHQCVYHFNVAAGKGVANINNVWVLHGNLSVDSYFVGYLLPKSAK